MIIGIYKIRNIINNKLYIGSTADIKKRWRDHKWYLKMNKHHNSHLQASYNKYGLENFKFTIELECSLNELLVEEKRLIDHYNTKNNKYGYNVNDPNEIQFGIKCNDDTKKILSERMMGDKNPMYNKTGNQHPKFKYKISEEKRNKLSEWGKNRKGDESNASKLSKFDVIQIRTLYRNKKHTQTALSKIYNVTQATISDIILRKSWTHI